jgi:hypothetical protein
VTVTLTREGQCERWQRDFAGSRFSSVQMPGTGRDEGLLLERFGPIVFGMALVVEQGRLRLVQRKGRVLGLPMPRWMLPKGEVYEHDTGGRFNFHVDIVLPIIGPVVGYRGWLRPA